MMLSIYEMEHALDFKKYPVQSLVIENPSFMYRILLNFRNQIDGKEGDLVLSEKSKIVKMSKKVELISDFIMFDVNQKNLITKILQAFDKDAHDEIHFVQTEEMLANLESYIISLSMGYDVDIECSGLSFFQILKSMGLKIQFNSDNLEEKIYAYMELVREFDNEKLFVLVNMRSYISPDRMKLFIETIIAHEYMVLFIESHDYPCCHGEKKLIIDYDLCEI